MGKEIESADFSLADFTNFEDKLRTETNLLKDWFGEHRFVRSPLLGGYELEAWLVDDELRPAPVNEKFLRKLNNKSVVPELSRFNVEFNAPPEILTGGGLGRLEQSLRESWGDATQMADAMGINLLMIGVLPTVCEEHLTLANMSNQQRYRALNEQVLRMRHNRPLQLHIAGSDSIQMHKHDVMLESAATSFQIHLQVDEADAARYYNAAQIVSAPMVAATSNSPFLFGKSLWTETRIPLFEQAVNVQDNTSDRFPIPPRVTFGTGYVNSLLELFVENLERHPILLPAACSETSSRLEHLRLHNGTIWRWNRPLVGFAGGKPHLRIEHRVVPAGPSIADAVANAAMYYGLVHSLVTDEGDLAQDFPFDQARQNFYRAARYGLTAEVEWFQGARGTEQTLLLNKLLPAAARALRTLDLDANEIDHYLGIVERRVRFRMTGADWQRDYVAKHGFDMKDLVAVYLQNQQAGEPVCEWKT